MSVSNGQVFRIFGGNPADADSRNQWSAKSQRVAESLVATTSRKFKGPNKNGHFSLMSIVGAGAAPVGTMTVWYSNLPDPDETSDADWVQDASIASVNMATPGNTFTTAGNVDAEWVRVKMTYTSGTVSLIVWARVEGTTHGGAQ